MNPLQKEDLESQKVPRIGERKDFKAIWKVAVNTIKAHYNTNYLKIRPYHERLEIIGALSLCLSIILENNSFGLGYSTAQLSALMIKGNSVEAFSTLVFISLSVIVSAFVFATKSFILDNISRILRAGLTDSLIEKYFRQESYYRMNRILDNPDQRIAADAKEFTRLIVVALDKIILSPVLIIFYSKDVVDRNGFKPLFFIYAFVIIGFCLQKLWMPRLVKQRGKSEMLEGDYRFSHATVRNKSETIFLSKVSHRFRAELAESYERINAQSRFVRILQFPLEIIGNFFAYFGGVVNYIVLYYFANRTTNDPAAFAQEIQSGSFKTIYLIHKLTTFIELASDLSALMAHSLRLKEFYELVDQEDYVRQWESPEDRDVLKPTIVFSGIHVVTPDERCHIKDFDLRIAAGQNVYITGPNGSGKTSLVRVLTRLWQPNRGRVAVQGGATIACAPQDAVLFSGSLLEQLGLSNDITDHDEALRTLMAVNLASLPVRTDGLKTVWPRWKWAEMLSPGETQRLVLARVILESPSFAVLDEATSAVDSITERQIYEEIWRRGITTITIGHRLDPGLAERFSIFVTLDGKGGHVVRFQGEELVFESKRKSLV